MASRNYKYFDFTLSLCSTCLNRIDAKVIFQNDNVYLLKNCSDHGVEKTLIATDVDYYLKSRNYIKPSDVPKKFDTQVHYGCFRLLEEFVRGDSPMPDAGFMKPVQWLLLLAVIYFARVFYNNELKPEKAI